FTSIPAPRTPPPSRTQTSLLPSPAPRTTTSLTEGSSTRNSSLLGPSLSTGYQESSFRDAMTCSPLSARHGNCPNAGRIPYCRSLKQQDTPLTTPPLPPHSSKRPTASASSSRTAASTIPGRCDRAVNQ